MVEFAMAIPIFLALLFGTIEVGMAYKTHSAYQEAALEAVRVAAAAGNATDAVDNGDVQALGQLQAMLPSENLNNISAVTIYDATASGSPVKTPWCDAISLPSCPQLDNTHTTYIYSPSLHAFTCKTGSPLNPSATPPTPPCPSESNWDPATRRIKAGSLDHIGIQLVYTYRSVTGILPPITITETASTIMEPYSYGP